MKLKPLYDRVVVLPDKVEEKSEFGIILPNLNDEKSCMGTVVFVGDGQTFDGNKVNMYTHVGDKVIYSKFSGTSFKFKDDMYVILRQADIMSIVEEN